MPWHAGGPQELTVGEVAEYRRQMHVAIKQEQKAARAAQTQRR